MLRQTRMTILLSLNAAAILIAGILIASAIGFGGDGSFRVVDEKSDEVDGNIEDVSLLDPVSEEIKAEVKESQATGYTRKSPSRMSFDYGEVSSSGLWSTEAVTIYQTADIDLCINDNLSDPGEMYWQTSDQGVIKGFYSEARTRLGYDSNRCRYPAIVGTGTVVITAGTMDGIRRDTINVTVLPPPEDQWKRDVLSLVNEERANVGLSALTWGTTCESAAQIRAQESVVKYDHTRPDGTSWETACHNSAGGVAGENLAAGNTAVSPETVVQTWMNSETHRNNILSDKFTKMAVGFVFDPNAPYRTYWSQFFSTY